VPAQWPVRPQAHHLMVLPVPAGAWFSPCRRPSIIQPAAEDQLQACSGSADSRPTASWAPSWAAPVSGPRLPAPPLPPPPARPAL